MPSPKSELKAQLMDIEIADTVDSFEDEWEEEAAIDEKSAGVEKRAARWEENGGWQALYNTESGDVVYPPVSILANKMLQEHIPGTKKRQWSLEPIKGFKYKKDTKNPGRKMLVRPEHDYFCPLHPDSPERAKLDEIGWKGVTCKANKRLADVASRDLHFRNKHRRAYDTWERNLTNERAARAESLAEENQKLMRMLIEAQISKELGPIGDDDATRRK